MTDVVHGSPVFAAGVAPARRSVICAARIGACSSMRVSIIQAAGRVTPENQGAIIKKWRRRPRTWVRLGSQFILFYCGAAERRWREALCAPDRVTLLLIFDRQGCASLCPVV